MNIRYKLCLLLYYGFARLQTYRTWRDYRCLCRVTKDVPDFAVVAGNPAKVMKYRQ